MPSVYAPCPTCHGARYNRDTLRICWQDKNIAEVLHMTVDEASQFFATEEPVARPLRLLSEIGLGYLRLGQPATELSGGEAQRIKLATELQRSQRGHTLYILDEPTTGLHASDADRLLVQLQRLVDAENTVIMIEHDMRAVTQADQLSTSVPERDMREDARCRRNSRTGIAGQRKPYRTVYCRGTLTERLKGCVVIASMAAHSRRVLYQ